jgi:hypothetical protein
LTDSLGWFDVREILVSLTWIAIEWLSIDRLPFSRQQRGDVASDLVANVESG